MHSNQLNGNLEPKGNAFTAYEIQRVEKAENTVYNTVVILLNVEIMNGTFSSFPSFPSNFKHS